MHVQRCSERIPFLFLALYVLATVTAWIVGPDGALYWDAHGYVIQALTGRAGGLMLGRPTFVLVSHGLARSWIALGGELRAVEPFLRTCWMLVSAAGAPALAWLALQVDAPARVAWTAGFLLALSPVVAHTSRAVLTDGPSMTLGLVALALGAGASARGQRFRMGLAGAVLGLAGSVREPALAHALTLLALAATSRRRPIHLALASTLGCALTFTAPVLWFVATQPSYLDAVAVWIRAMRDERARHPYGWRDVGMFLLWSLAAAPGAWVALVNEMPQLWRSVRVSPRALVVIGVSALQWIALAFYQDISFSPRYLLGALGGAVLLPAAWALETSRWRQKILLASLVFPLLAAPLLRWHERPLLNALRELPSRLDHVERNSVVVSGQACPAVVYERALRRLEGRATDLLAVCPGWYWPTDLEARLNALRAEGRPVVLDLREGVWVGPRQHMAREELRRYVARHGHNPGVTVWP
jgi:hypothetical protein